MGRLVLNMVYELNWAEGRSFEQVQFNWVQFVYDVSEPLQYAHRHSDVIAVETGS